MMMGIWRRCCGFTQITEIMQWRTLEDIAGDAGELARLAVWFSQDPDLVALLLITCPAENFN
jgi:hypothetical protein